MAMPFRNGIGSIACAPESIELPPRIADDVSDYDGFEFADKWHWSYVDFQKFDWKDMTTRPEDAEIASDGSILAWGVDSEKKFDTLPRRLFFPSQGVARNTKLPMHFRSAEEDRLTAISLSDGAVKEVKLKSDRTLRSASFDPMGQFHQFGEVVFASSPDRRTIAILGPVTRDTTASRFVVAELGEEIIVHDDRLEYPYSTLRLDQRLTFWGDGFLAAPDLETVLWLRRSETGLVSEVVLQHPNPIEGESITSVQIDKACCDDELAFFISKRRVHQFSFDGGTLEDLGELPDEVTSIDDIFVCRDDEGPVLIIWQRGKHWWAFDLPKLSPLWDLDLNEWVWTGPEGELASNESLHYPETPSIQRRSVRTGEPIGERFSKNDAPQARKAWSIDIYGGDKTIVDSDGIPRHVELDVKRDWLIAPKGNWLLKYGTGIEAVPLAQE